MVKKKVLSKDVKELVDKKLKEVAIQAEEIGKPKVEDFLPKCKKCFGVMGVVRPTIEMSTPKGIMELHECRDCHEREYL